MLEAYRGQAVGGEVEVVDEPAGGEGGGELRGAYVADGVAAEDELADLGGGGEGLEKIAKCRGALVAKLAVAEVEDLAVHQGGAVGLDVVAGHEVVDAGQGGAVDPVLCEQKNNYLICLFIFFKL